MPKLMDNKTEPKFEFPKNYQEIIDESSIVRDFDKFIEMAIDGKLELTKNNILTLASLKLLNENIIRTISIKMKRPLIRSYPNILALFVLFSLSGLGKKGKKGKKKILELNSEMLEQWKQFTDVDKYFYLFSLLFTNFSFETINDGRSDIDFFVMELAKKEKELFASDMGGSFLFEMYKYKTVLVAFDMFGLVTVKGTNKSKNKSWNIESVTPKSFMKDKWNIIKELIFYSKFNKLRDNEDDDFTFTIEDIDEISNTLQFADKITEQIPEFTGRLKINLENKPGIYFFKVKLGRAWRTIKIDYRNPLDDLCYTILDAFDFDNDHLYDVSFLSSFGYKLTFNGMPGFADEHAEYPTTEDITIGNLPIQINDEMIFTFDYGDNWQFSITLEQIEPIKNETNKIPKIKITESKGDAPEQYPEWE